MSVLERVKEKVSGMFSVDDEETILYDYSCNDCEATFMAETPPEDAICEECGSDDVEEERRMYAGGSGVDTV